MDKSAVGFEYQGKTEKHESQKGGFDPLMSESLKKLKVKFIHVLLIVFHIELSLQ